MSENKHAVELDGQNFDDVTGKGVALVDFWAPWCGPCRSMGPVIDALSGEFEGKALVGKVNIDESDTLAARFGVMTIPSLFILKNGEVVKHFVGVQSQENLKLALNAALEN